MRRGWSVVLHGLLAVLLLLAGAEPAAALVDYRPPVEGGVLRGFEPPRGAYGPGHRGLDLAAEPGDPVGAAAEGEVVHAGEVVGVTWVSIDHPDGVRTSYGPLTELAVTAGQRVGVGERLGRLAAGGHGHGGGDRGLHLGARRDGVYLDPVTLLGHRRPSLSGTSDHRPTGAPAPAGAPPGAATGAGELPGGATSADEAHRPPRAARPGRPVAP